MKRKFLIWAGAALLVVGLGSCAYDNYNQGYGPANSRTSVGVSYGTGHGYGYGGSAFSTSFFWSTGNPRWGYDPYSRAYFDYTRRSYYDPWLYGYYPVGYRPPVLVGIPHPSGYRSGWCPPPRVVNNVTVVNYRQREQAYRQTNHGWARNVRYDRNPRNAGPPATRGAANPQTRRNDGRGDGQTYDASRRENRGNRNEATPWTGRGSANPSAVDPRRNVRGQEGATRGAPQTRQSGPAARQPERYNSPVAAPPGYSRPAEARQPMPQRDVRGRPEHAVPQQPRATREIRPPASVPRDNRGAVQRVERQQAPSRAAESRMQQPTRAPEPRMRQPQAAPPAARAPGGGGVRGLGQGDDRGNRRR